LPNLYLPGNDIVHDRDMGRSPKTKTYGASMHKLAACYYRSSDELAGNPKTEIQNLYVRMRRLAEDGKFKPVGKGKKGAVLYAPDDAAALLMKALSEDKIAPEKAKGVAFAARQEILPEPE